MTILATEASRLSAVIAHEYEPAVAYCRDVVAVTVVADMAIGAVLGADGALVTALSGGASYVLIDERVKDLAPGSHNLLVLSRGPVILKDYALTYGADVDTQGEKDAVHAALKAKGMIVEKAI